MSHSSPENSQHDDVTLTQEEAIMNGQAAAADESTASTAPPPPPSVQQLEFHTVPEDTESDIEETTAHSDTQSQSQSHSDTRQDMQTRIESLEEQLAKLALVIETLQNEGDRKYHNYSPPNCTRTIPEVNSILEAESPPPGDKEEALYSELQVNTELPDLEYRSYTPDYEEGLRKLRKTSRGMSVDTNDNGSTSRYGSCENLVILEKDEEKKEDVLQLHPGINNTAEKDVKKDDFRTNIKIGSSMIQTDILAEGKKDDATKAKTIDNLAHSLQSKTPGLPPKSPERGSRISLATAIDEAVLKQNLEHKMNSNAVVDFIRGLNIDSRQQDGSATEDVDANMEEFLRVPYRIENLLFFGWAICVDSFLNVLTVTPLKFIWSCLCLVCTIVTGGMGIGVCRFHRRHLYQLLRVFVVFAVYNYALCPISMGKMYHWIRGQAMLKLYVLMAMVVSKVGVPSFC